MAIRERSGMSPAELAEAVGIDRTHLINIEAGRRNASPGVAMAIACALRVPQPAILTDPNVAAAEQRDETPVAG